MACKTCDQWERLYKSLKKEAERDLEVCRELSLELDRMRDIHGTDELDRQRAGGMRSLMKDNDWLHWKRLYEAEKQDNVKWKRIAEDRFNELLRLRLKLANVSKNTQDDGADAKYN